MDNSMEKGKLSIEKRQHPRIDLNVTVKFRLLSNPKEREDVLQYSEARTINLSQSGIQLGESTGMAKGDLIKIEIEVPDRGQPIKAYSEVMWVKPPAGSETLEQAGIKFMGLKDEDEDFLAGLVERAERKAAGGDGQISSARLKEDEFIKNMGKRFGSK